MESNRNNGGAATLEAAISSSGGRIRDPFFEGMIPSRIISAILGLLLIITFFLPWAMIRVKTVMWMRGEEIELETETIIVRNFQWRSNYRSLPDYLEIFLGWPPFYHNALLGVIYFPLVGGNALVIAALFRRSLPRNIISICAGCVGLSLMAVAAWRFEAWWPAVAVFLFVTIAFVITGHFLRARGKGGDGRINLAAGIIAAIAALSGAVYIRMESGDWEWLAGFDRMVLYALLAVLVAVGAAASFAGLLKGKARTVVSWLAGGIAAAALTATAAIALFRAAGFVEEYWKDVLDARLLAKSAWLAGSRIILFILAWSWSAGGGAAELASRLRAGRISTEVK